MQVGSGGKAVGLELSVVTGEAVGDLAGGIRVSPNA